MIFPKEEFIGKNKAINYLWNRFEEFQDKEYVAVHDVRISNYVADCIVFIRGKYILLLSVKDCKAEEIKAISSGMIKYINRPPEYSGIDNLLKCRQELINQSTDLGIREPVIVILCCYPFISTSEWERKGIDTLFPRELTILVEDLIDNNSWTKKLEIIDDFVVSNSKSGNNTISDDDIVKIGKILIEDFDLKAFEVDVENEKNEQVDLYANDAKELYYGICSFLMKNGIIHGYIYSKSKELLDSLGDYMDSVNIPWSYYSGEASVGYVFVDDYVSIDKVSRRDVIIDLNDESTIIVKNGMKNKYIIKIHNRNAIYNNLNETKDLLNYSPIHLKNEQIREMFLSAFKIARKEIDIISPWMNFGVVNENFVKLMESALQRGVKICILYGLNPDSSEYNLSRSNRSDQVAKYLKDYFSEYETQLEIKRDNIHYKLVLCDELFKLEGGYNYLSFTGDYSNTDTRKEGSPYGTQVEEIRYLRKEYFGNE